MPSALRFFDSEPEVSEGAAESSMDGFGSSLSLPCSPNKDDKPLPALDSERERPVPSFSACASDESVWCSESSATTSEDRKVDDQSISEKERHH